MSGFTGSKTSRTAKPYDSRSRPSFAPESQNCSPGNYKGSSRKGAVSGEQGLQSSCTTLIRTSSSCLSVSIACNVMILYVLTTFSSDVAHNEKALLQSPLRKSHTPSTGLVDAPRHNFNTPSTQAHLSTEKPLPRAKPLLSHSALLPNTAKEGTATSTLAGYQPNSSRYFCQDLDSVRSEDLASSGRSSSVAFSITSKSKIRRCHVCKEPQSELSPLVRCCKCRRRYHRGCHNPLILGGFE